MGNLNFSDLSPEELEKFNMEVDEEYNPTNEQDRVQARLKYRMKRAMEVARLLHLDSDDSDHRLDQEKLCHKVPRPTPEGNIKVKSVRNVTYVFENEEEK